MPSRAEQSRQLSTATNPCLDPSSQGDSPHGDKTVAHSVPKRKYEEQGGHFPIHASKYHRRETDPCRPTAEPTPSEHHLLKPPNQESTQRTPSSSLCLEDPTKPQQKVPRRSTLLTGPPATPVRYTQHGAKRTDTRLDGTQLVCRTLRHDDSGHVSKSVSFFTLPAEIRNIVYKLILHYPDCARLYSVYYQHVSSQHHRDHQQGARPQQSRVVYHKNFHTPSLLLLCRSITAECTPILRSHTLIIDRLPPFRLDDKVSQQEDGGGRLMKLADFVGRATLQNISHVDLRVGVCEGPLGSAWLWKDVVGELYEILAQRNRLATLRLLIRVCNVRAHPANITAENEYMRDMATKIKQLGDFRYPNAPRPERVIIELWLIDRRRATFESGRICEPPYSSHPMEDQPDRFYPDREMFPGSITEFLKPLPPPFSQE